MLCSELFLSGLHKSLQHYKVKLMKGNYNWQQLLTEVTTLDNIEPRNLSPKNAIVAAVGSSNEKTNMVKLKEEKLVEELNELKRKLSVLEKGEDKSKTRVKCYNCKKRGHLSRDCCAKRVPEGKDKSNQGENREKPARIR